MKKIILTMAVLAMMSTPAMAGCMSNSGLLYSDTVVPFDLTNQAVSPCKVGKSTCDNYMGAVQLGDCSLETAMRNGKITRVNHVDLQSKGWFFFKHMTVKVYGE